MPATPVKIGPFAGGLNSYSDPTAVGDNECTGIQNFDIDLDGSLYGRYPIGTVDLGSVPYTNSPAFPLGFFINTNGDRYLIVAAANGTTYARNEETDVWSTITNTFAATCMVQYADKAWLIAPGSSANPGGSWTPGGGFVADADIPKGGTACIYKERLFVSGTGTNANRVYFSNAADFGTWNTSVNFFDARSGDGQHIIKLQVFQDTIVIFKERSTYAFSYDSSPTRGAVRVINTAVGCTNSVSVVEHENSLYVHHEDNVYQMANWTFTIINLKVPFEYVRKFPFATIDASLSVIADRLIVHHYDNIYVFNLRNGTWTIWSVDLYHNFNYFVRVPQKTPDEAEMYYAGFVAGFLPPDGSLPVTGRLLAWTPDYGTTFIEEMECYVQTKVYDFNVAYTFKRLFWWGVDMLSKRNLSYTVHPVQYTRGITHDEMSAYTHDQLALGTHLQPISVSVDVSSSMNISNVAGNRMFIKLLKSMRFRQIFFTVSGTTDGTVSSSPLRIYSLIAFIDNKQLVSKEVS